MLLSLEMGAGGWTQGHAHARQVSTESQLPAPFSVLKDTEGFGIPGTVGDPDVGVANWTQSSLCSQLLSNLSSSLFGIYYFYFILYLETESPNGAQVVWNMI